LAIPVGIGRSLPQFNLLERKMEIRNTTRTRSPDGLARVDRLSRAKPGEP
jgi:hypothetical protein